MPYELWNEKNKITHKCILLIYIVIHVQCNITTEDYSDWNHFDRLNIIRRVGYNLYLDIIQFHRAESATSNEPLKCLMELFQSSETILDPPKQTVCWTPFIYICYTKTKNKSYKIHLTFSMLIQVKSMVDCRIDRKWNLCRKFKTSV